MYVALLRFDREMADLSGDEFAARYLLDWLHLRQVVVGQ